MLIYRTHTSVSVNFAIIVFYELFNEGAVLVEDFVTHVRDVMQNGLILDLENQTTLHVGTPYNISESLFEDVICFC